MRKKQLATALGGAAVVFGLAAANSIADPGLSNVSPHRHFVNGVQVGPRLCDNRDNQGVQQAFNQFHNNNHRATNPGGTNGPVNPGLDNDKGGEITATGC
jgi:hypothetical protein